jgi:transporter family-2 protein
MLTRGRATDVALAMGAGLLLALMINFNSLLAKDTTPVFASWVAHGVGAVAAFILVLVCSRLVVPARRDPPPRATVRPPFWSYLGGLPGAFTVVLAAITVTSSLNLSGSVAAMLFGQVTFGILSDRFGLFRMPKRNIGAVDVWAAVAVLGGSALIIFGGGTA